MREESNDRLFCREQALRTDPVFRMSHLFAGKAAQDRLLPLYAFFSAIEQVCSSVSDEEVAARTLAWWHGEMQAGVDSVSDHPVVTELRRSGAAAYMPPGLVKKLLDDAGHRIDASAPASGAELERLCLRTGQTLLELELAACGADEGDHAPLRRIAMRRGLMQLIRESLGQTDGSGFWWVPLDLLARYGLARADLLSVQQAESAKLLMSNVLGMKCFEKQTSKAEITDISNINQKHRHIFVYDALSMKKLNHMKSSSPVNYPEDLAKPRIGDLLLCWRTARRFSLSK